MPPRSCLACQQKTVFLCNKCGTCAACCISKCGDQPGRLVSFGSREYEEVYRGQLRQQLKQK